MKYSKILLIAMLLIPSVTFAQKKMTDQQIIQYVIEKREKGLSQSEIFGDLMKKGVDLAQLQKLRKKYAGQLGKADERIPGIDAMSEDSERERKSNKDLMLLADSTGMMPMPVNSYGKQHQGKKIFGHDIFTKSKLTFESDMNIATPDNYKLGTGDHVIIDIYGASQLSINETISPDGYVTIDDLGPVMLGGMTVEQANKRLNNVLGARFEGSQIKLFLGQTRSVLVNVAGEVNVPGTYTLSAFSTVFHALYMAGGVNEIGTLRDIKVYRNNKLVSTVDVYDFIVNGNMKGNVKLNDNDMIIVGSYDCLVKIDGKVKRPMFYEMKKNETVGQLIDYAGGFAGDAYTKSVRLLRKTGRDLSVYNVDEETMASFTLADEDAVEVDSIIQRYSNAVEIKGAVFRPGLYQIGGKILTVKNLVDYAEGLTEDAFSAHAVLQRMKLDRTMEVMSVDLAGIMNGTVKDIYLQNEDVLLVPSDQELKQSQTLTIHGEVFHPGVYKYASNITIEDFILMAGGLKESASSVKVDVARRIVDQKSVSSSEMRAMTYSFELKDGFIVGNENGFTLQPYDQVYVRRSPGYSSQVNVNVTGEVLFAGTYTLAKRETRLSDVIMEAGGVTKNAYVKGTRLQRYATEEEKLRIQQLQKISETTKGLDAVDTNKLDLSDTYFVGIDLEKALSNPGGDEDIVLHEGDNIIVPQLVNTVKVNGEVMYPNTIGYISGKSARYYISQAGGYSTNAKKSRAYIIYQNGKVVRVSDNAKPAPGCEIVVPSKKEKSFSSLTTQWVALSTSIATLAALIVSIF